MIIGAENNFDRINYNNGIGYVHKDYIGVKATSDLNGACELFNDTI